MKARVIPSLMLMNGSLVKTCKFAEPVYVGDPINTVRVFSKKYADELILLDITRSKKEIDFNSVARIAEEASMPLSYGGGITTLDDAKRLFDLGVERLIFNNNF